MDRSSLRLAFVAAVQHLSPRERGALILREVLSFSAAESAEILGISVAAVNSSLQRARARMKEANLHRELIDEPSAAEQRAWVERYMTAFERADVEALKRLLTQDVVMEMPPLLNWFAGVDNYGLFMDWVFQANGTDWRLVAVAANGQPAFAAYNRVGTEVPAAHLAGPHRHRQRDQPQHGVPRRRNLRDLRALAKPHDSSLKRLDGHHEQRTIGNTSPAGKPSVMSQGTTTGPASIHHRTMREAPTSRAERAPSPHDTDPAIPDGESH